MTRRLAAVAALSLLAAACGGAEREPNLARAGERTAATGSFRVDVHAVGTQAGERLDMQCEAAIDLERTRARVTCVENGVSGHESIYVDDNQYVREPDTNRWTSLPGDEGPFEGEAISPERLLDLLRGASRETERIGEEVVRDVETVRYRLTVECEGAELTCPPGETSPVDVWIDDEGLVRRIQLEDGGVDGKFEFYDFGAAFDIEAPPADLVDERQPGSVPEPKPCVPEDAEPIRTQQAIDVLGDHGFDVKLSDFGCPAGVAASVSNFDTDQALDEATLICYVLVRPSGDGPGDVLTTLSIPSRVTVERRLENLQCTLHVEEGEKEGVLARLDAALAELKRAVRP